MESQCSTEVEPQHSESDTAITDDVVEALKKGTLKRSQPKKMGDELPP